FSLKGVCWRQRRDGPPFGALGAGKQALRRPLLDENLSCPIIVVRLSEPVFAHLKLMNGLLGRRNIAAAVTADRAAEPCDRLCLREWRFRNFERCGFRPCSALECV